MTMPLPPVVLVTGTSTEVGKTIATAALACTLADRDTDVAVVKLAQTGVDTDGEGDTAVITRLTAAGKKGPVSTHEFIRLPDPLAPDVAARRAGVVLPTVGDHVRAISEISRRHSLVLVEGSGGLLVRLDGRGSTLADVGVGLRSMGIGCGTVLVASAGLGTLNHSALTAEALHSRQIPLLGVIIGSWPQQAGLAERCNVEDLPLVTGVPLLGSIPQGAGFLTAEEFAARAPDWLHRLR